MSRTVLIMAGGTGGHVFPALAVATSLRENAINVEWLGTLKGIEVEKVPAAGLTLHTISIAGVRGKGLARLVKAPFQVLFATIQSILLINRLKPICVVGFGGFVSGPGGVAAWLIRCPLLIHEQNAVIGLTNKLLSHVSRLSYFAFPQAARHVNNAIVVGNPVRQEVY